MLDESRLQLSLIITKKKGETTMGNKGTVVWIVLGVIVLIALMSVGFIVGGLNTVVTKDEAVSSAWAQVENQLQRRNDLIPNLVNTVKGFAAQEREIFLGVADARSKLAGRIEMNESISSRIEAANQLSGALSRLLLIVERYPDLKSNQNFARLQDELAGTENRIAVERKRYNDAVRDFNTYIRRIPGSFFASLKGMTKKPYFEIEKGVEEVPQVSFE
jgi:LemA protein